MLNVKALTEKAKIGRNLSVADAKIIEKAFNFSQKAHQGQKRKSGEPYFSHSYETALKTAEWQLDAATIAAALLHDVIEDAGFTLEDVKKEFGEEIAFLVDGVSKIGRLKYRQSENSPSKKNEKNRKTNEELRAENLRKMILALSRDLRVVLIKLADRLHNMKTLSFLPPQKQKRIALETSEIYAPLAYRLGMQNLSGELEDLTFPYLHPAEYKWLIKNVGEKYDERRKYLEKAKAAVEKNLKENGIDAVKIDFRVKRYSSLYKKLLRYDMNLEQIYDLVALRIIVKTVEDCYAVLGVIHGLWPPLPGKIKDYIAMPKPNGYRSIHTTVFCLDNRPTEFQIRTGQMHYEAENGIAAHWAYSEKKSKTTEKEPLVFADKKKLAWVEQLRKWQEQFSDSKEFLQSLKIDFLKDRIFAVTPKGEVMDLPAGATPVDFAYAIHSDIGNQCVGTKINGKIAPLDYQIQSGDLVEILVQKNKKPSESWLEFAKTSLARKFIKSAAKKSMKFAAHNPPTAEFRLIVENKIGVLKNVSSIFSQNRVNIQNINTAENRGLNAIKIRCATDKEKAEKLVLKLKKIKEVKEIGYKII